jgi:hypothetical protein
MRYAITPLLAFGLLAAVPAHGATREDIYQALQRCNAAGDNRVWLDCLYGAVQPMRAELGLPPASANQVKLVPQSGEGSTGPGAVAPQKQGGFLSYVLGGKPQVNATMLRSYNFDGEGRFTVTLANGQVWRQVDDDRKLATWKADPAHYQVAIRTGALGSNILEVQGEPGAYMVRHVP